MIDALNKIKSLVKRFEDLSALGVANVVGTGISAIFWFYLASLLTTENYGEVGYWISIASITSTISIVGATSTVTVYTAKNINIFAPAALIAICTSIAAAIILFLLFSNYAISSYVIGYVIFNLAIAESLGYKKYKTYAKFFLLQKALMIFLAILLYFILGPNGVILGFALSFLVFVWRVYHGFRISKIDFSVLRSRYGLMVNSYGSDLSRAFSGNTDKLIIAPLLGFSLLGNYHLGLQFLSLLTLLPSIVMQYTLPQDASGVHKIKLKKVTVIASAILATIGIILAPIIIPYFFPKYESAVQIVQIISIAAVPRTISGLMISKFLGLTRSRFVLIGVGIYLGVQIPGIIILGQIIGINGVALALVLAECAQAVFLLVMNRFFLSK